jgi:hypothetical protein
MLLLMRGKIAAFAARIGSPEKLVVVTVTVFLSIHSSESPLVHYCCLEQ